MEKELMETKNDLITRAEEMLANAKKEKRELTDDEIKEFNDLKGRVSNIEKTLKIGEEVNDMTKEEKKEKVVPEKEEDKVTTEEQEKRAFENYIRGTVIHERAGELTKTENGAVIPTSIADEIIKKVYDISPVLEKSHKYNVQGNLELPYYDTEESTINVAYSDEFSGLTSSNGKFKNVKLTGYLAGALSKISRSLINNAKFDIVNFVVNEMADAIARFIEKELLVGTTNKVEGLSKLTNKFTLASASVITADELIDAQAKVKDAYQNNAIWIMNSNTRTMLRKLKDNDGRYLLQNDITSAFGYTLLGKTVYVSDNMPDLGASKVAIYYGDMSGLATKFNEEIDIQVLREKYADEHADGVIGWLEFDSKVENAQKIVAVVGKGA